MTRNEAIPESINRWHIAFDPYGFTVKKGWLAEAERTEDILQLHHDNNDNLLIDVGWYHRIYGANVIVNKDWQNPLEFLKTISPEEIENAVYLWIAKYANGVDESDQ